MEKLQKLQKKFSLILLEDSKDVSWIASNTNLTPEVRSDIYRGGIWERLYLALEEDYPILTKALDDKARPFFKSYLKQYPSRSPSLTDLGAKLPEFLLSQESLPPYFSEVARLEWYRVESYYAHAPVSRGLDEIKTADENMWLGAKLIANPSFYFFSSPFNLNEWLEGNVENEPVLETTYGCFFQHKEPKLMWFSGEQFEFILCMKKNMSLSEIDEQMNESPLNPELFAHWMEIGLIHSIQWPTPEL